MITLRRMSLEEYEEYRASAIDSLAQEEARAFRIERADALASARKAFDALLPDGRPDAPNQYLHVILDGTDRRVGWLWFEARMAPPHRDARLLDLVIDEPYRRRGHARRAMLVLEEKVRELGLRRISLSVFEHNSGGRRLHESMGYEAAATTMVKCLS